MPIASCSIFVASLFRDSPLPRPALSMASTSATKKSRRELNKSPKNWFASPKRFGAKSSAALAAWPCGARSSRYRSGTMATTIRRAKADDADFLAGVMLSASRAHLPRGVWDLIIGADVQGCLDYLRRLAVAEPRSPCHYEAFLVAEVDGELGAALCGFEFRTGGWATVAAAMT